MTQQPSRLKAFLPESSALTPLHNQTLDMVFFGLLTKRRHSLLAQSEAYLQNYTSLNNNNTRTRQNDIAHIRPFQLQRMATAYANAKVCLVVHSYSDTSGGEYHRLSELSAFGCIPVVEQFADTLGMEGYQKCGRVVFAPSLESVVETAAAVIQSMEQQQEGKYQDFAHVEWWNKGIQWETILTTVLKPTNTSTTTT